MGWPRKSVWLTSDQRLMRGSEGLSPHRVAVRRPVAEVLAQADRFQFTSGKDAQTESVYFTAQSKDKKVLIEFEVRGRRMSLARVRYSY
jgi:hypothetical protein